MGRQPEMFGKTLFLPPQLLNFLSPHLLHPMRGSVEVVFGGEWLIVEVSEAGDLFGRRCLDLSALVPFIEGRNADQRWRNAERS